MSQAPVQGKDYQGHKQPHPAVVAEASIPEFNDSKIINHPDKLLLSRIQKYFKYFATGDVDGMDSLYTDNYTITDIPLAAVGVPRGAWKDLNKGFGSFVTDRYVEAISLYGNADFAILENVGWFRLVKEFPENVKPNFPGVKVGDKVGMINASCIWWNKEGKVYRELEYGRVTWPDFDINHFTSFAGTDSLGRYPQIST
ncbi:hypothetical protein BJ878DRAFT_479793 [Calycina marina]|uniref:SnoaL-like domain-containing protein n=1 Tax=Calycina marina TaxID=1763456 RepID=A0A9P7Z4M8_9HELO|nr:hypothetical protein BJ878DRAFT_479793 [Calycina marina]